MANAELLPTPKQPTSWLTLLPPRLRRLLSPVWQSVGGSVEEIRIVQGQPIIVRTATGEWFVAPWGVADDLAAAVTADESMIHELLDAATRSSVYAVQDAMRAGYLTLPGGHRVGLAGEAQTQEGDVVGFRHVTGFNIRINREVRGACRPLLKALVRPDGGIWSTLVISPPGGGKTTLLRDLIRALSYGEPEFGLKPHRVGVADERGELAGGYRGLPQNDLGPRADVIDQCPKRHALAMLVRAMGPEVVVTDEIGHPLDAAAVLDAVAAGVALVCSAHGSSLADLKKRPTLRPLLEQEAFQRVVVLSRRRGPGTIERVVSWGPEP